MALGMSDAVDLKSQRSTKKERPRSSLGSAYERIRQFVRPKAKRNQIEPGKKEQAVRKQKSPAVTVTEKDPEIPTKLRGLAYACERQRQLRDEQGKASSAAAPGKKSQYTKADGGGRANGSQCQKQLDKRGKHHRRRAYEREESQDSSSDSNDENADNQDLWFLSRRGIELEKKLGEGTYAQVHAGRQVKFGRPVAVKIINLEKTNQRYRTKFLPRETELLRKMNHPNIVRLFATLKYDQKVFFVTDLAQRGDLLGYIQKHKSLTSPVARTIFSQIVDGIEYLHQNGIYHRDLKCENILLDPGHKVKLTDFGFAREWYEPFNLCRTYCGSAAYASPEILQGLPYDPNTADIWSMGIVLFVMVQGKMPFDDADVKQMLYCVRKFDIIFTAKRPLCIPLRALIKSILNHGQWDRASIGEIKANKWLDGSFKA